MQEEREERERYMDSLERQMEEQREQIQRTLERMAEDTPAQYPKSAGIPASSLPPSLLVYPHPPTCLHQRSLDRRVRSLQAVPQGSVLWVSEPVGSVSLQGSEFSDQT